MALDATAQIRAGRAMTTPIALTIAGSDSSGGAGIQADLKTFAALGVYGASVITALTAQNTSGVTGIHQVPADFVTAQIDAVFGDLAVGAVKIGMVAQLATIDAIAAGLERWSPQTCRARSRDGGDLGRPAAGGGRRRGLAHKTHSARLADHAEPAGGRRAAGRAGRRERGRDREPGQAAAGDGLSGGADQGRPRAGRREHRLSRHGERHRSRSRRRASPPKIPTAPDARCRRPSRRALPKARTWKPPCATPRPGSAPRSPPPIASASATATGRSIISTGFTELAIAPPCPAADMTVTVHSRARIAVLSASAQTKSM